MPHTTMVDFEQRIQNIVSDREHGSSTLVTMIVQALRGESCPPPDARQVRWALGELRRIDPSMVVVHHLLDTLGSDPGDDLPGRIARYQSQWSDVDRRIAGHLLGHRDWAGACILTHSHSGMLLSVIRQAHRLHPSIRILQTRSEPGGEGVLQHRALQKDGVPGELLTDEEAVATAPSLDAGWFGVDQYSGEHFVNKLGSGALTRALLSADKPVYVLGDTRKRVSRLRYSERLFEAVPLERGIHLVTEKGVETIAGPS